LNKQASKASAASDFNDRLKVEIPTPPPFFNELGLDHPVDGPRRSMGAVTSQSIGYFDPFPLLLRLDRVLRKDFLKLPRLRRILSPLAAGRQRIRSTRKQITRR
jgi:hypothetical protein